MHPYEAILRMCAMASPKPWYPRTYAQSAGIPEDQLYYYLENLWLDGLVQKAEGAPETGPGLTLTEAGRDVLDDPAALQRLKEGQAVKPGDQGGVVRAAIRRRTKPTATLALIAANAAAFLYTVYLASRMGIVSDFISLSPFGGGNPKVTDVIVQAGAVYGGGWLAGEWWRLLTSCFIHIGALHILANMYALYKVGAEVERWWGSWRYLVIYLFAGLGGSCLALGLEPRAPMAGASGAICGVLGAAAVWVLCNGRHLPRSLAVQIRGNLLINGVLITFISLMPGVSWQGHLGGAAIGAAVALVMQVQRFGPSPWRWAVLAVLVPLPWLGYAFIDHERRTNPVWKQVRPGAVNPADDDQGQQDERTPQQERKAFDDAFIDRLNQVIREAYHGVFVNDRAVLDQPPGQRDGATVKKVKRDVDDQRAKVKQLADDLARAGPYKDEETTKCREAALRFVQTLGDFLNTAYARLSEDGEWTPMDDAKAAAVKTALEELKKLMS